MYKINGLGTPKVQISKTHVRKDLNRRLLLVTPMNNNTIKVSDEVYKDLETYRLKLLSKLGVESMSKSNVIAYLLGRGGL